MKPQIVFFTELLGPSLIINLTQLVSPSVALPAELVKIFIILMPMPIPKFIPIPRPDKFGQIYNLN